MNEAKLLPIGGCMADILKKILKLDLENKLTSQKLEAMIVELQKKTLAAQDDIKSEIKEIRKTHLVNIPCNIQEQYNDTLTEWRENNKNFIKRHAVEKVLICLKENSSVTVTGSSGTGKTALVRLVACMMKDEGYFIVPTTDPVDIRNFSQKKVKILFVFDDVCGNYSMDMHAFEAWYQKRHEIKSLLKGGDSKIISTCRLEISKDDNFKQLTVLNECICNLSTPNLDLNHIEKSNIARVTFKDNVSRYVESLGKYDCFPLLCSLYHRQGTCNTESFINNPFNFYKEELDEILSLTEREVGKRKFCCLALCVVYNNNLEISSLSSKEEYNQTIIGDVLEECELNKGTSPKLLIRSAENLLGSYFVEDKNSYRTIHDKLFDFLSCYMGSKMIEVIIKHAPSEFISERLVCGSQACNVCSRDEFDILVTDKHYEEYVKRLQSDLLNSKIIHVLSKRNLKCPSISNFLLESLQNLTVDEKKTLINMQDRLGQSILFHCCQAGNLKFTKWILHIGADINRTYGREKNTCLHIATLNGHTDLVCEMLQNDAIKMDLCNETGHAPLYIACENGNVKVVKELLLKGADVNQISKYDGSPISAASSNGHVDVLRILIEKGAKHIDLFNIFHQTPLFLACKNGHLEVVKELLTYDADINKHGSDCNSPLHASINSRSNESIDQRNLRIELACELLKRDSLKIAVCNINGQTPLHLACRNQYHTVVQELLKQGADINICDEDGNSALHETIGLSNLVSEGHEPVSIFEIKRTRERKIVSHRIKHAKSQVADELLMQDNIDILVSNKRGETPLHLACEHNNVQIVKALILKGASINKVDNKGNSPLHRAVLSFSEDAVEELLKESTIDIDLYNKKGKTPLRLSCSEGCKTKAQSQRESDIDNDDEDEYLSLPGDETSVKTDCDVYNDRIALTLIARGADINKCDWNEQTPLHGASENGKFKIVQEILNHNDTDIGLCDNHGNTPLHLACHSGQVKVMKELIQKGASINKVNKKGDSPLHKAIISGNQNATDELLKKDSIIIDNCNSRGETQLHSACGKGLTIVVKELLRRGASINKVNEKGDSPLHTAIINSIEEVVNELLKKDTVDIDKCNDDGTRPLHYASENGITKVVTQLLQRGASINKVNDYGDSPLHRAIINSSEDAINELLKTDNIDVDMCNKLGNTPLHHACSYGLTEVVKELISKGASINQVNNELDSPLHIAIVNRMEDVITELLKEDTIDLDLFNKQGNTPLHLSCSIDHTTFMRNSLYKLRRSSKATTGLDNDKIALALLERGVNINKCDGKGRSPLHLASIEGKLKIVQKLLQSEDINMDLCDQNRNTPLHLACHSGHVNVMKELILRGATITNINEDGDLPLHTAIINGKDDVVDELLKEDIVGLDVTNKEGNTPLHLCCRREDVPMSLLFIDPTSDPDNVSTVVSLIKRGANMNKCDEKGRSPLHMAIENRKLKIAQELLKHDKTDINLWDKKGHTPLHLACQFGLVKVARELINRGASINEVDNEEHTPLYKAIAYGNKDVVNELLKGETIDIDTKCICQRHDKDGNTPLHYACRFGLFKAMKELIVKGASINVVNKEGNSPLHTAIINGNVNVINELLNRDTIVIDACNNEGNTPFHLSCSIIGKKKVPSLSKPEFYIKGDYGYMIDTYDEHQYSTQRKRINRGLGNEVTALTLIARGVNITKCNAKKRSALHISSVAGHLKIVQELLMQKIDIDLGDDSGNTPLHLACQSGHAIVMKELIQSGASINKANNNRESILHLAITNGYDDVINELLQKKTIQVDETDYKGNTPLHYACRKGLVNVMKELILKGASVTKVDENGQSPLHIAIINKQEVSVDELLKESNIEIDVCDNKGNTPLQTALLEALVMKDSIADDDSDDDVDDIDDDDDGDDDDDQNNYCLLICVEKIILALLNRGADFNKCDSKGRSPLHMASKLGFFKTLQVLLKNDININLCDSNGNIPLHLACQSGQVIVVNELILHGASINAMDNDGESPLHKAIVNKKTDAVKELLKVETIDVDIRNKEGRTALHYASGIGLVKAVKELIRRKAYINKVNNDGDTPLHVAIIYDNDDVINELLQQDTIDVNICNKEGNTPLHYACRKGFVEVGKKLIIKGASINKVDEDGYSPLHKAIIVDNEDLINNLLQEDTINVDVCDKEDNTPLHYACGVGLVDVVKDLILKGASVNKVDKDGYSPLHKAIIVDSAEVINELLQEDTIDIHLCNKEGNTPLHYACGLGNVTLVKKLILMGASINKVAKDGCSPFHRAVFNGNDAVVDELLNQGNLDLDL